jgi:aldehyde dehydrogenase
MAADIPLAIDHFRYFAGCLRAQEGSICEIDDDTVAYHFHEPLGVVGQIIPWNFPILMAAWKLARRWPPATAWCSSRPSRPRLDHGAGRADRRPAAAGRAQHRQRLRREAGKPLATSKRIAKIAFTGETTTGRLIMQYAART